MTLDPTILSNLALVAAGFAAAFLVALWLSLIVWTNRDIRRRARDPFMRILAVLIVAVLFLPGMLIYLILRPTHTLDEEYQRTLEEEALLQSIEDNPLCPGCGRHVREDWVACPTCYTRLKKTCQGCARPVDLAWNLCPFCGTPSPGTRSEVVETVDTPEIILTTETGDALAPAPLDQPSSISTEGVSESS